MKKCIQLSLGILGLIILTLTGCATTKVIILSVHDEKSVLDDVMAAGVEGFVLKRRAVIDLIPAIREVLQGHKYISPDVDKGS